MPSLCNVWAEERRADSQELSRISPREPFPLRFDAHEDFVDGADHCSDVGENVLARLLENLASRAEQSYGPARYTLSVNTNY